MAEIHKSQRNNEKLAYCDFIYNRKCFRAGKIYWTCYQRGICNGRATSTYRNGVLEVEVTRKHTHGNQPNEVALMRLRTNLKLMAVEQCDVAPIDLVRGELKNLPAGVKLPTREVDNLCREVGRSREFHLLVNPCKAADLKISEVYFRTISHQQFLLHDNIILNEVDQITQRTVIFATENNLRNLFASSVWYVNGSFHIVPTMFHQLWTIHGKVKECIVPLVYTLMQTKKEEEYLEVLVRLQQKAVEFQIFPQEPSLVMVDFNRGAVNAIKTVFPRAELSMCLFHYKQSLWKKIQDFCLQSEHNREGSAVKKWVWYAIGMAYVPPEDVVETFELLLKELESIEISVEVRIKNFVEYLERNYIRGQHKVNRMLLQRYPIELWTSYRRTLTDEVRIDCLVEEWHKRFNSTVYDAKWSLDTVVSAIRNEQNNTECDLSTGRQRDFSQTEKTLNINNQIRKHVMRYQEFKRAGNILEYIRIAGSYHVMSTQ